MKKIRYKKWILQYGYEPGYGIMLTPGIYIGSAYAIGIEIEWLKWKIAFGYVTKKGINE